MDRMTRNFSDDQLKALLANEISAARNEDRNELTQRRERALEYYQGEMKDTQPKANRSAVVSYDVATTINWMLPGIIRVFTASDIMGEFEPARPSDEAFAEQATDYANYVFFKDNPGYRVLWDGTFDALLMGNGIIKHYWDDTEDCEYSEHSGLDPTQLSVLLSEDGVEVVSQSEGEAQSIPDPQGNLIEVPTYDVKIKRIITHGRVKVECIEPEDFFLDAEATTIEGSRFCAHRQEVTRSELIKMGFDRTIVDGLAAFQIGNEDGVQLARESETVGRNSVSSDSMTLVELFECYLRVDVNDDGVAETVRAYYAGDNSSGELLDWEVWEDEVPFSDIPCEPVPHRWDARSIADETLDVQRVKTVMTRGLMDNIYWTNEPMTQGEEKGVVNPEILHNPVFGGHVKLKAGAMPVTPLAIPFIGDKMLLGLQHWDEVIEKRTGVSRTMMALDPEALQNQTATANQNARDAAYSQVELIARNMAELGWRRVFRCILKLIVKHQDRVRTIRLRDKWVDIDPRHWNTNMDVTINVGLGTGSRDRDMSMLNNILQTQMVLADRLGASGMIQEAAMMLPKVINTAMKLAESAGLKNPEEYYPEISEEQMPQILERLAQQQSQPPPEVQQKQAEMQMTMQLEVMKAERQRQTEQAQMEADLHTKSADMKIQEQSDMRKQSLEMEKMRQQWDLEMVKLQQARELKLLEMGMKSKENGEVASRDDERFENWSKSLDAFADIISRFEKSQNTKKRIVRDENGFIAGVEPITEH